MIFQQVQNHGEPRRTMKNQRGQVLLIVILLSTVLLTIGLSISQITTQETQIAKLEEESKKAFAAAEAGLDAALKQGTIADLSTLPNLSEFQGSAIVEPTTSNVFVSPLLKKDEQYTFYLADYVSQTFGQSIAETITICYGSPTSQPALEITLVKQNSLKRYVVDYQSRITGADPGANSCSDTNFSYSYNSILGTDIGTDSKLLIVRALYADTKLRFSRTINPFPLQGKTITSAATTSTGVTKKIQLFQSYPQIPSDFFITSF